MGALDGIKIIEMAGIGPAPFAGMMLADHGAEVIRVERPGPATGLHPDILNRSRRHETIDLKSADGIAALRTLVRGADGLIEGFRPGVMERLGLGPDVLIGDNPRLVYGRMTGWGQDGPYAQVAGHDINYIAMAGVLHGYGRAGQKPTVPGNAVGDYGGGGMMLAFAMLAGIISAGRTGHGQVIDCAMVDGAALLSATTWSLRAAGQWRDERGVNLLDTGAACYDVYETSDGHFVSIGPIEPQFFARFREMMGLADDPDFAANLDPARWPAQKATLEALFRTRTRADWCALLEATDICFAPVLSMPEAPAHPHNAARGTFGEVDGVMQPMPAPRFSRTPANPPRMAPAPRNKVS
jgi:alpha-methylacyl-CoA racemase